MVAMTSAINPISLFLIPYINDFELSYSVGRSWLLKTRNFGNITIDPCLYYFWKKIQACMVNSVLRGYRFHSSFQYDGTFVSIFVIWNVHSLPNVNYICLS